MVNLLRKYTVSNWLLIATIILIALICGFSVFLHPGLTLGAAMLLSLSAAILIGVVLCRTASVPLPNEKD